MKISANKAVTVSYTLRNVAGDILDQASTDQPLAYLHGVGMMLPAFEAALEGREPGDMIKPILSAEEGYGSVDPQMIVNIPKEIFAEAPEGTVAVGNFLPMQDQNGNHLQGRILEIGGSSIKMDFNHPLADTELHFEVIVVAVREATQEELEHGHVQGTADPN